MSRILTGGLETISVRNNWDAISIWHLNQAVSRKEDPRCVTSPDARLTGMGRSPGEGLGTMSSWKHFREEGRHFAKKHRVGAKRALVGVLIAAMTISTMNVPAIAEELGITADAQEQIIQDSTVNTENQSATAEGTPTEGTNATVDEGDDPADTSADAATDTTADAQPADDQQPDEAAGTESDQNNLAGEGSSENDPAAVEEDTTAQVAVKVANASLKYTDANGAEQTVSENKDAVDFPTQTEIKFSVTANDGFQASRVFYTVDGADTDVAADESGVYTIPAEVVNDGLAITVETAEIPTADEPAADDAAGEAEQPAADEGEQGATGDSSVVDTVVSEDGSEISELEKADVVADVSSPAFEGYAYVGEIVVKVTAGEGVVPEGTTVQAYEVNRQDVLDAVSAVVEQKGNVINDSVAIDVTLLGPAGNVIQPEGAVNVCFFNTSLGDGDINVYRVADDASTVQEINARQADSTVQSFDVNHFSIYVVDEETGEPALATYTFMVNGEVASEQTVKNGDVLYEPAAPEAPEDGYKFVGWYTAEDGGDLFNGFGEQQDVVAGETVLYARFDEVHYVFFYDEQGRIFHTEEGVTDETVDANSVTISGLALDEGLTGWYDNESLEGEAIETVTIGSENIYLWPKVEQGHWITFDTDGGTYIEPQFTAAGDTTTQPETPARTGYTFSGWKTEEGDNFSFGNQLSEDVTLVAQWTPGTTSYRVIYWVEKANWKDGDDPADRYSYMKSDVIEDAQSGSRTNVQGLDRWSWDYSELDFNDAECQEIEQQTVEGDGSTIVNVYYNRAVEHVYFYIQGDEEVLTCGKEEHEHTYGDLKITGGFLNRHYEYTGGCYGDGWHREWETQCGLEEHQHNRSCYGTEWITAYSITAKVGAYIGDQWPRTDEQVADADRYIWCISEGSSTAQVYLDSMPSGGDEFWGEYIQGNRTGQATYWVRPVGGGDYIVHHIDTTARTGSSVSKEEYYDIQGFTFETGTPIYDPYDGANFYYSRNKYQVTFINGNDERTATKEYEENLSDLASEYSNPSRPDGADDAYVFAGWYDNA